MPPQHTARAAEEHRSPQHLPTYTQRGPQPTWASVPQHRELERGGRMLVADQLAFHGLQVPTARPQRPRRLGPYPTRRRTAATSQQFSIFDQLDRMASNRRPESRRSIGGMVFEFQTAFGLTWHPLPTMDVDSDVVDLRISLLAEEVSEYYKAVLAQDLVKIADGLADIVYIAFGTAITYGIDLDEVLAEVHRSNMTKLGRDRRPMLRDDGKVLKPPHYEAPDISLVLAIQPSLPIALKYS